MHSEQHQMSAQPIKIAILAMGGEGGGVLADWIVNLGEHNGYIAQTTSVPGVAQRTGATIYYVELYPAELAKKDNGLPVLALMPLPGDVDIVLASELMEAGRSVQRGLVTPDRTTLIASNHRVYSIAERSAMGDGRIDSAELSAHAQKAAKRYVSFDMAQVAEECASMISAVLFGSLAGVGALPFKREQFEATVQRGGLGVQASLKAFGLGYSKANTAEGAPHKAAIATHLDEQPSQPSHPEVARLLARVKSDLPAGAQHLAIEGLRRMIDYQDLRYAELYLDRLSRAKAWAAIDGDLLMQETARYLALWMSYEDTIRVADLKIRASRFDRVRTETKTQANQQLAISEFMHPRIEEICETLPAGLGRWLAKPHAVHNFVAMFTRSGRNITTSSLPGFLLLWSLSRLRFMRRKTLRYQNENAHIEHWLQLAAQVAKKSPSLALEVVQCQRLVKGYSDTHARGLKNYQALMRLVQNEGNGLTPALLKQLRDAALADEHGKKLQALMAQHALA
jgi:indolepyruvate ferredoxin oxidoreductase, beta subunit